MKGGAYDGETVITGSFNLTKSAEERNAENLLIIEDEALARKIHCELEGPLGALGGLLGKGSQKVVGWYFWLMYKEIFK